jgi:SAM-dependent methyltransferase
MTPFLYGVARAVAETFDLPAPLLEIGSLQVEAERPWADLRPLFPGKEYLGLDIRRGPGVDLVGDVEALPRQDGSVGTVLAMSTFEHVRRFWRGFEEIRRVLRPGGALLVSCPFNVRIHAHPSDYWRFTPEALDVLLEEDYPQRIHGRHGPQERPENVWALAFRPGVPPLTPAVFARYRTLLARHARQPQRWRRRLRQQFLDWLDGRRTFAPYLEQNQWATWCPTLEVVA